MNSIATQQPAPTTFNDSLALRARNLRFRGVGNPYAFLDGIGIVPIKEFLYRGANIIDLADALNLPISTLHLWIDNNNYGPEIEEASVISAEGYIRQGEVMLKNATNKFDLDKSKAMLEHGRFMASKKNKRVYGNANDIGSGQASVSYTFNIGAAAPQEARAAIEKAKEIIDGDFTPLEEVHFNLQDQFALGKRPAHLEAEPSVTNIKEVPAPQDHWHT